MEFIFSIVLFIPILGIFFSKQNQEIVEKTQLAIDSVKRNFEKYKMLSIWNRPTPLIVEEGEHTLLAIPNIQLCEERNIRNYEGISIRFSTNISYHTGKSISNSSLQKIDIGDLYITTFRLVFFGKLRTMNLQYKYILGLECFNDAITLHKKNNTKSEIYYTQSANLISCYVEILLKNQFIKLGSSLIELTQANYETSRAQELMEFLEKYENRIISFDELKSVLNKFKEDIGNGKIVSEKSIDFGIKISTLIGQYDNI